MISKWTKRFLLFLLAFVIFISAASFVRAQTCDSTCPAGNKECLSQRISDCQNKIGVLQGQSNTLSNQIAQFNAQIQLTTLKIEQTEEQIKLLGGRIDQLETSLGSLSNAFSERAVETYRMYRSGESVFLLLDANSLSDVIVSYHYLAKIQEADRNLMIRLQKAQNIYVDQKSQQEVLAEELDKQQKQLTSQKVAKANLLAVTKNDEKKYKNLLSQAQAELSALANSQFTGKREVKRGEIIGLMGSTGFSSGPHLHFGYYNLTESQHNEEFKNNIGWYSSRDESPVNVLASRNLYFEAYSCDDVQSAQTKSIGLGSLPWPLNTPRITQCYGHTPYSYVYSGNFHEGIDMVDTADTIVRALDDGVAYFYRGNSSFGNNVRVFHSNGKMSLYMHLQ